jgi:hypothetical protein
VTIAVLVSAPSNAPAATIAYINLLMTLLLAGPQAMARLLEARLFAAMHHWCVKVCEHRQHRSVTNVTLIGGWRQHNMRRGSRYSIRLRVARCQWPQ